MDKRTEQAIKILESIRAQVEDSAFEGGWDVWFPHGSPRFAGQWMSAADGIELLELARMATRPQRGLETD